jgi:hypothetical protein
MGLGPGARGPGGLDQLPWQGQRHGICMQWKLPVWSLRRLVMNIHQAAESCSSTSVISKLRWTCRSEAAAF